MSAHRMERYAFGWVDPRGIFTREEEPPTHKRWVTNEDGAKAIFENDYVHGIENDKQKRITEGTPAGAN